MFDRLTPLCCLLAATLVAQEPDPALARMPADATTALLVRDLLPPVQALLRAPQVVSLLENTRELQQQLFGLQLSPAQVAAQINFVQDFVPVEVGLALGASTAPSFADALRGVGGAALLTLAKQNGVTDEELAELKELAKAALPRVREPSGVAWVKLRRQRMAEQWFDQLVAALEQLPTDDALQVTVEDSTVAMQIDLLDLRGGRLRTVLREAGLEPVDAHWRWRLQLKQDGAELHLRIGEPVAGPLLPTKLGAQWSTAPEVLATGEVDLEPLSLGFLDMAIALAEVMASPNLSPRGQNLLAQFETMASGAAMRAGALAKTSGRVEISDGLMFISEIELGEASPERPPEALARCVRPDEGPFQLTGVSGDAMLAANLNEVVARAVRTNDAPSWAFEMLDYLTSEESSLFDHGSLWLARAAEFRGAPDWKGGAMPFGAIAWIGVLKQGADGATFMSRLLTPMQQGLDEQQPLAVERDLGLGVPTHAFRLELFPVPLGPGVDADWAPHWCVADRFLIVSSDVALTRDLIARLRGDGKPARTDLVDWMHLRSDHLAAAMKAARRWLEVMRPDAPTLQVLDAAAAVLPVLDRFEWISEGVETRLRTRLNVRLAPQPK